MQAHLTQSTSEPQPTPIFSHLPWHRLKLDHPRRQPWHQVGLIGVIGVIGGSNWVDSA